MKQKGEFYLVKTFFLIAIAGIVFLCGSIGIEFLKEAARIEVALPFAFCGVFGVLFICIALSCIFVFIKVLQIKYR